MWKKQPREGEKEEESEGEWMRYVKEEWEGWKVPRRKNAHDNSAVHSVAIPTSGAIYAANPRTFLAHVSPGRQVSG